METKPPSDGFVPLMESSGYQVKEFLDFGGFGHVYLCKRRDTAETVAVKAVSKVKAKYGKEEVQNLESIRNLDPDKNSLIRFNRHFELKGNVFLEFEKLDMTLYDLVFNNSRRLFLSEIQIITRHLLVALNALKTIKLVHCDIKLDNIMLTNPSLQTCKVKLIDFGVAYTVSNLQLGNVFQVLSYRAPEVSLGLPLSEAVDMWSLGSVLATAYLKAVLYSGYCELANMNDIVQLLGQPDDHMLNTGLYTSKYFSQDKDSSWKLKMKCSCSVGNVSESSEMSENSRSSERSGISGSSESSWSSKSNEQHKSVTCSRRTGSRKSEKQPGSSGSSWSEQHGFHPLITHVSSQMFASLDDIVKTRPGSAANEDTQAFISLLKEMMQKDPKKRISPSEALRHPFIAKKYFRGDCAASNKESKKVPPSGGLVDRATANTVDRSPQKAVSHDTNVTEPLPASASHVSNGDKISSIDGTMGPKIKAKNKLLKRVNGFFSQLFKKGSFTSTKDEETAPSSNEKPPPTAGFADRGTANSVGRAPQNDTSGETSVTETSPASACHVSNGDKINTTDRSIGSKVRTKHKLFKRFHGFFSHLFKDKETAASSYENPPLTANMTDRKVADSPPQTARAGDINAVETCPASASSKRSTIQQERMNAQLQNDGFVPLMESSGYEVKEVLGYGGFGHVYLCRRSDTREMVAVKAMAKVKAKYGKEEVQNLESLRNLDPDQNSLIRFNRHFELQGNIFLEFEKLDMTLYDFVFNNSRQLFLSEIQLITQQLLVALNALKSIKMVHCDIKLQNIMLTNPSLQPCKVKLIDFGLAHLVSNLESGDVFQELSYRAPEVSLGLPLSEAVDMWSLGSIITTAYLKATFYSRDCELANMNDIVQLCGQPDDHLLNTGLYSRKYFYKDKDSLWKLKTVCSCPVGNGLESSWISGTSKTSGSSRTSEAWCSIGDGLRRSRKQPGISESPGISRRPKSSGRVQRAHRTPNQ